MKSGYYKDGSRYVPCKILGKNIKYEHRIVSPMGSQGRENVNGKWLYYLIETEDGIQKEIPEEFVFLSED